MCLNCLIHKNTHMHVHTCAECEYVCLKQTGLIDHSQEKVSTVCKKQWTHSTWSPDLCWCRAGRPCRSAHTQGAQTQQGERGGSRSHFLLHRNSAFPSAAKTPSAPPSLSASLPLHCLALSPSLLFPWKSSRNLPLDVWMGAGVQPPLKKTKHHRYRTGKIWIKPLCLPACCLLQPLSNRGKLFVFPPASHFHSLCARCAFAGLCPVGNMYSVCKASKVHGLRKSSRVPSFALIHPEDLPQMYQVITCLWLKRRKINPSSFLLLGSCICRTSCACVKCVRKG